MKGRRLLVTEAIMIDCCELRRKEIEKDYTCRVLHEINLGADKETHCGLWPCLMDGKHE